MIPSEVARALDIQTSINGKPAEWPVWVWQLWYTHIDRADPKLYDTHGIVTAANYWTPRPHQDQYERGSLEEGFTFTVGREVYLVTIATHVVGSPEWDRLMHVRQEHR